MSFWDTLDPRYRVILCDVWGVIHDGVDLYPGAADRLRTWQEEGRRTVLVTNAPRPADAVARTLRRLGLDERHWNGIATSGEAGIAALLEVGSPVGLIGSAGDRAELEGRCLAIAADDFTDLACTGIDGVRLSADDYRSDLARCRARGVTMHCLNPDRIVIFGGAPEVCAGAIADLYEAMGGTVAWYGKPDPLIYRHALRLAGDPPLGEVLAVGDSLQTDMLGAAGLGVDAVFVAGGIHRGEGFDTTEADRIGLGDWRPVAIVDGLD